MTWSQPVFPPPPGRFELRWFCRVFARCGAARPLRGLRVRIGPCPFRSLSGGALVSFNLGVSAQGDAETLFLCAERGGKIQTGELAVQHLRFFVIGSCGINFTVEVSQVVGFFVELDRSDPLFFSFVPAHTLIL